MSTSELRTDERYLATESSHGLFPNHEKILRTPHLGVLLGAVYASPFYIVAHYLLGGRTIAGKSATLVLWSGALGWLFLANWRRSWRTSGGIIIALVWGVVGGVLALRFLVYGERVDVLAVRFAFTAVIYGAAAVSYRRSPRALARIERAVIVTCLLQAVLGIVHRQFFPHIVTGMAMDDSGQGLYFLNPDEGGFRENGTLISSNTYGAVLVLGLILTWHRIVRPTLWSWRWVAGALCWSGIALSESRYALGSAALVTLYLLRRVAPGWLLPVVVPLAVALLLSSSAGVRMRERFAESGSGGRGDIAVASFNLVAESYPNLFIGVSQAEAQVARTPRGQVLSDNSLAALAFDYGVPAALLVVGYLWLVWAHLVRWRGWVVVTTLVIAGQFAITNAIYWDQFVLLAGATLVVVDAGERRRRLHRRAKRPAAGDNEWVGWARRPTVTARG